MKRTMEWPEEEKQKYFSLGDIAPKDYLFREFTSKTFFPHILMEQNILMSPLLSTAINY